ncbi:hypothetical protein AAVH_32197 [Aphelenchoides avenae]|nr:hypothetical protein AAVH_32197 [Aphelenchus avenae]
MQETVVEVAVVVVAMVPVVAEESVVVDVLEEAVCVEVQGVVEVAVEEDALVVAEVEVEVLLSSLLLLAPLH